MTFWEAQALVEGRLKDIRKRIRECGLPRSVVAWAFDFDWEPSYLLDPDARAFGYLKSIRDALESVRALLPDGGRARAAVKGEWLEIRVRIRERVIDPEFAARVHACVDLLGEDLQQCSTTILINGEDAFDLAYEHALGGWDGREVLLRLIDNGTLERWPTVEHAVAAVNRETQAEGNP